MNGGASITQGRYEASGSSLPNDRKMSNFKLLGQTVAPGQALSPMNKNTNFPIQVMQLISEQAEDRSELNFAIFTQKQVNHDWAPKDQMARVLYYGHFGKFAFGVAADAAQANENAPIRTLLKGDTLYYTKDKKGNICIHTKRPGDGTPYIELNGDKVLKAQREVQVWRANDVGDEALERMLNTKKGEKVLDNKQKAEIEKTAQSVVIRNKIFFLFRSDGSLLDKPVDHVIYYACYPRLTEGSPELSKYLIEKEKIRNVKKLVDPLEGNGIIKKGLMTIKGILTGKPVRKTWQDECIKEKVAHLDKDKLRQDCKKLF